MTANADGTLNITTYGDGSGLAGQWTVDTSGGMNLATVNSESARLSGTRKIIGGLSLASAYSTSLSPGGTPTVVYASSSTATMSVKVTFAVQSNGATFQWEQFDVTAVRNQDVTGTVNVVVTNRVKGTSTVADTQVTATINGSSLIEISLNLDAVQTSGGTSSFDAVEFMLMQD